jgi:predicted lactoylglutathione lyase
MTTIQTVTLEVPDVAQAEAFYRAFGVGPRVRVRAAAAATTGFRGFTLSLVVSQPSSVDGFVGDALDAGATVVKPAKKSMWGYGAVLRSPDGAIWKIATSSKKDTGPARRDIDELVLLLGVEDVKATKQFYVDRGLEVTKSYGRKYVEFAAPETAVKLSLLGRRSLAKEAGVTDDGDRPNGIAIVSDAGAFTDPDGFVWEPAAVQTVNRPG